ncbi:ORFL69W [Human betaherpesvirus 5]|nr:ORFL69W [Human betaherpesvirus 5]QHX40378.1 ORFL69W [Human betaherpesvirus 5]
MYAGKQLSRTHLSRREDVVAASQLVTSLWRTLDGDLYPLEQRGHAGG